MRFLKSVTPWHILLKSGEQLSLGTFLPFFYNRFTAFTENNYLMSQKRKHICEVKVVTVRLCHVTKLQFIWRFQLTFFPWECLQRKYRSSHQRCSVRKSVLTKFAKFTVKHLCQSLLTLLKNRLCAGVFLWILQNF